MDVDPSIVDRNTFVRKDEDLDGPIYEFLYLDGSIKSGKLSGRWVPPPASPTNAALLWPGVLNYIFKCIRERTPEVLQL